MIAKRWQDREQRWIAPGPLFRPADFAVDIVEERIARPFVERHHYAGTYPAARLAVGLFGPGLRLVGVAVFSVPMNQRVVPAYTGLAADAGVELGRFVCTPEVAYNGETWFLARALRSLRLAKPEVRAVISYADPIARTAASGRLVKPEHWGTIYQASNALYVGAASPRTLLVAPSGMVVSGRALSKLRLRERGWEYAERQLIAHGAPPRAASMSPAEWLSGRQFWIGFRTLRHPGNLTYLFGTDSQSLNALRNRHGRREYPRRAA